MYTAMSITLNKCSEPGSRQYNHRTFISFGPCILQTFVKTIKKLLIDVDENALSPEEVKERRIMKLLLKGLRVHLDFEMSVLMKS